MSNAASSSGAGPSSSFKPISSTDHHDHDGKENEGPKSVDELQLPLAVVNKIIRDALPAGVIVSKEAKQAMSKAAAVYILYCTSVANNLVMENKRKTLLEVSK